MGLFCHDEHTQCCVLSVRVQTCALARAHTHTILPKTPADSKQESNQPATLLQRPVAEKKNVLHDYTVEQERSPHRVVGLCSEAWLKTRRG